MAAMVQTTPFCQSLDGKMAKKHLICSGPKKPLLLLYALRSALKLHENDMLYFPYVSVGQSVNRSMYMLVQSSTDAVQRENVTEIWKIKSEESAIAFYVYFVVYVYLHAYTYMCAY